MTGVITERSSVVAIRDQVSSTVAGETIILNYRSETYYGLDAVGGLVWRLIQTRRRVCDVQEAVSDEYGIPLDRCRTDVLLLLQSLAAEGLIEVNCGTGDEVGAPEQR